MGCPPTEGKEKMIFLLIWFIVIPEQGVRYHHLSTHANETLCRAQLKHASVLVSDKNQMLECVGVKLDD
jgi:hypothetical protein